VGDGPRAVDLSKTLSREESEQRQLAAQRRLLHLRLFNAGLLESKVLGPPVTVVFEGWDASGKGGIIRRLAASYDPRHVTVVPIAAPNEREIRHHFLWRFAPSLPGWGGMTVFDRSWYGRLLVERVEQLITREEAERSARQIVSFEKGLTEEGMVLVKVWLEISADEQLKRFMDREQDPLKRWKLTADDWRNRERREDYEVAADEMLSVTSTHHARWDVIAAEQKHFARATVLETLVRRIEVGMRRNGIEPPESHGSDYSA
jgi:polyphosphate kinase 2 (PPK2 family)